jgi:RNA polymerase sigma-70 factor, ECF subfamily
MNMLATKPGVRTRARVRPAQVGHELGRPDIVRAVDSTDSVLVARMVAGDEEALTEVWQRHGPVVFGHARRLTRDASIAEDVAQEVFVAFWAHPERFDPDRGSLRSYLGVHARRRAIDKLRQDSRRSNRQQRHYSLNESRQCAPDAFEERAELFGTVRDAISRLPLDQREAVELAYFGGLTHCEIAGRLGIPEGTAKSRLRLAQTKLRAWLGPVLEEVE